MVQSFREEQRAGNLQQEPQRREGGEWNRPTLRERKGIRSVSAEQDMEFALRNTWYGIRRSGRQDIRPAFGDSWNLGSLFRG
jgi:hypothetical protein